MRTNEERIEMLHRRAAVLEKKREKDFLILSGISSCVLMVILGTVMFTTIGVSTIDTGIQFTGSSLLSNDAGAYVLVAVISFTAAVIITVLCINRQKGNKAMGDANSEEEKSYGEGKFY